MAKEEIISTEVENKAYELAYLLDPKLADETAVSLVADFVKEIENLKGALVAQDGPEMHDLAYTISRVTTGKRSSFDNAYFGWIRFTLGPAEQLTFAESLKNNQNVIRYQIISVPKTLPAVPARKLPRKVAPVKSEVEAPEMTSEQIDKEVEELIQTV